MKKLITLFIVLLPTLALADVINFQWTAPATRTDGTTLSAQELDHYTIYCNDAVLMTVPGTETSAISPDLGPGTYQCFATVTDTNGRESASSNATTTIIEAPPGPPSDFSATATQ